MVILGFWYSLARYSPHTRRWSSRSYIFNSLFFLFLNIQSHSFGYIWQRFLVLWGFTFECTRRRTSRFNNGLFFDFSNILYFLDNTFFVCIILFKFSLVSCLIFFAESATSRRKDRSSILTTSCFCPSAVSDVSCFFSSKNSCRTLTTLREHTFSFFVFSCKRQKKTCLK